MTAPAPEKAAPIPAEVRRRAEEVAVKWLGAEHEAVPFLANDIARMLLPILHTECYERNGPLHGPYCPACADREARPSLPDSREERIRAEAAEDERDRLFELFRNDPDVHAYAIGKFVIEGAKEPWWRAKLRARARQGGNNG